MPRRRLPVVQPSSLPPLYAAWMDELLAAPLPQETEATCDDCVMLPGPGEPVGGDSFDPSTKCCTYLPELANFLVGRVLVDRDPAAKHGRETVEQRIDAKIAVTPLWIAPPAPYRAVYEIATTNLEWGRVRSLRCPHYLEGQGFNCGIWKSRNSVCATWFCKHVRGAVGMGLWLEGIQPLLANVERALSLWCVLELGCDDETLRGLRPPSRPAHVPDIEHGAELRTDPVRYARLWGRWLGKEREFYAKCANLVDRLAWKDVLAIGGDELRARARVAKELFPVHSSPKVPHRLRVGPFEIAAMGEQGARVSTYSKYDALELPTVLVSLLARFDGRPTTEVTREIARTEGVDVDDGLLRKLVDFGILVASDTERPPRSTSASSRPLGG